MGNITIIKVRGYHLDIYQHVNNARYLEFLEEARWDWLERNNLLPYLHDNNLAFIVANININYRRAAILGDVLQIENKVILLKARSGQLLQTINKQDTNQLIADATITFVCLDMKLKKATIMMDDLKQKILSSS